MIISILFIIGISVFFYVSVGKLNEGFETYSSCIAKGYTKEFCVQTPTSVWGPAGCLCPDGSRGIIFPGLRGECLCSRLF